ncbi:iron chelate uptake ABC transporter family permease subunit [Actinopolymorpha sp. B9G3]|uniref:FecCD family ABC transporter permease n=1 Tax=Actinopolymorpha sp. B9G3 TaxID=3158970 RepID=UPI0032D97A03
MTVVRTSSGTLVLRSKRPQVSVRVHVRTLAVVAVLVAALTGIGAVALAVGDFHVPLADVVRSLNGTSLVPAYDYAVRDLRLPRFVTAVLVGAALAASGAVFQHLTRNPLGSPDVIGCTQGAATGALLVILVTGGGFTQLAFGAVAGGLATAAFVLVVSWRRGLHGYRLVLVGIGLAAMLLAVNNFLLARANLERAQVAQAWLIGSLNARGWEYAGPLALALAVLLPLVLVLTRALRLLDLGDEAARAFGVRTGRVRAGLLVLSTALASVATAAAGPVIFLALAAPQIAKRLTRATGPIVVTSALTGALLLAISDLAAQRLFAPTQLPVGIATGAVGGVYLGLLLATQWRSGRW